MAKRGINKVILLGNVGQDPEIRHSQGGMAFANVTLATGETWRDKQTGEQKERTEWSKVVFQGKLAEIVGEYVKKGARIYVEGSLQTRKWQSQDGKENYTTEIIVDSFSGVMQIIDSPRNDNQHGGQQPQHPQGGQDSQGRGGYGRPQQQRQQGNGHPNPQGARTNHQQQQGGYSRPQNQPPAYNDPDSQWDDDIPF